MRVTLMLLSSVRVTLTEASPKKDSHFICYLTPEHTRLSASLIPTPIWDEYFFQLHQSQIDVLLTIQTTGWAVDLRDLEAVSSALPLL